MLTALTALVFAIGSVAVLAPPAEAIVGGEVASQEYPNMAAFLDDGNQICGASLIAPQWIISAAHCVDSLDPSHYSFRMGAPDLNQPGGETIQAHRVIVHPEYTDTYDVSLFQLVRPSVYEPIRLADPVTDRDLWEPGDIARVIGYGGQSFQLPSIDGQLREVDVPVVSDADCDSSYDLMFGGIDERVEVCAGELHGTKDSCQGDSGGPLIVPDGQGDFVQMGVVSWGFGCGWPTQYGVYARVGDSILYDWIQETIANTETPPPPPPAPTTVTVGPQGQIVGSSPFASVTEEEFASTCSTDLLTQGVDGYAWELPADLSVPGAVAQVTGNGFLYDLDIAFYGLVDGVCTRLGGSSTTALNERAEVPDGTEFVLALNWLGADTLANLTVELPPSGTITTTQIELSDSNATEGRFAESVTFQARLTDVAGTGIADQPVRFALVDADGETIQFAPGSPTDADGSSTVTMRLGVPAGSYTLEASFIGEPEQYADSTAEAPFSGLAADTSISVEASGFGADRQVIASLTELASATPVQGRTIEFLADCEPIGSAETLEDGTAAISVPARYRGVKVQFTAIFVGDAGDAIYYAGSEAGREC